ncbi:amylo-alpha-1,6-glucosidase [Persicobacter diffluens]|uniref:Glycogen debranching protein n=1 Tax=Persicobacter diffluens TaxID=981 RepID=A0AAN5AL78_9BACT|nr:glycogen debranching protein [Persicobacter diffluens]
MKIHFGRAVTGNLSVAESNEWLVTNGIGGYASGTIAGSLSRGYHGLLVASLNPPVDRHLMLAKLEEWCTYEDQEFEMTTNRWEGGSIAPQGFKHLQGFCLQGSFPSWEFAFGDAMLVKKIWMEYGQNVTYVSYRLVHAAAPVELKLSAIANQRIFHNTGELPAQIQVNPHEGGLLVQYGAHQPSLYLQMPGAEATPAFEQYHGFYLPREAERGLNALDSHWHVGNFRIKLVEGQTVTFACGTAPHFDFGQAFRRRKERDQYLVDLWANEHKVHEDHIDPYRALILAADQFVVRRQGDGRSIIAGYHWFEDWGRDTMISLTGLTLLTGRKEEAAKILSTFSEYISEGMLPNRFPDASNQPEYNTIDATLWYFVAIWNYWQETKDLSLIQQLFPKLEDILQWHIKGTRYQIKMDPEDHLLYGGEQGVQLTWMDARVGDWVVTPRIGKPVEVNALWYNVICIMREFSSQLKQPNEKYEQLAAGVEEGFGKFWNKEKDYCFDVIDGPSGVEDLLRPNQLLTLALPFCPFGEEEQRKIFDVCSFHLFTSHGLRSLAPFEKGFHGFYGGDSTQRDSAYHQGTVWAWWIGPYIKALMRVYQDSKMAMDYLNPLLDHLSAVGLGSISEIFNGEAPFEAKGCIAQAWSVGQLIEGLMLVLRESEELIILKEFSHG